MSESMGTVKLVGGPCDGHDVPEFTGRISIPIAQSGWARFGEQIESVAVYELDLTARRAHFIKPSEGEDPPAPRGFGCDLGDEDEG